MSLSIHWPRWGRKLTAAGLMSFIFWYSGCGSLWNPWLLDRTSCTEPCDPGSGKTPGMDFAVGGFPQSIAVGDA